MKIRNLFSKCTLIFLFTCIFFIFQPLIKNPDIHSRAWGGDKGWSDAFGNSQRKTPSAAGRSDTVNGGWDTIIDNRSSSPDSFDRPSPRINQDEKTNPEQREEPSSHHQIQEKSTQADNEQNPSIDSASTVEESLTLTGSQVESVPDGWVIGSVRNLSFFLPDSWTKISKAPTKYSTAWRTGETGMPEATVVATWNNTKDDLLSGLKIDKKKILKMGSRQATWVSGQIKESQIKVYCLVMNDADADGSLPGLMAMAPQAHWAKHEPVLKKIIESAC